MLKRINWMIPGTVLLAGVLLIAAAMAHSGRYASINLGGKAMYLVDKYTGQVRLCAGPECESVKQNP